jgi:hypothetical protein
MASSRVRVVGGGGVRVHADLGTVLVGDSPVVVVEGQLLPRVGEVGVVVGRVVVPTDGAVVTQGRTIVAPATVEVRQSLGVAQYPQHIESHLVVFVEQGIVHEMSRL